MAAMGFAQKLHVTEYVDWKKSLFAYFEVHVTAYTVTLPRCEIYRLSVGDITILLISRAGTPVTLGSCLGGYCTRRSIITGDITDSRLYSSVGLHWWRGSVVERRSLAGELSLSCA